MRKEPSSKSELVTQLLFGELAEVLEPKKEWSLVRLVHDQYEGWVSTAQLTPLNHSQFEEAKSAMQVICTDIFGTVKDRKSNSEFPVTFGCSLPGLASGSFLLGDHIFSFQGESLLPSGSNIERFLEYAAKFMHAPYLWGGRTPLGVDCSGLTQSVYRCCGISLPRDAWQQAEKGEILSFLEETKPGDLAFFDNKEGKIIHVGILLSPDRILHAGPYVRIDKIDHQGIFNEESGNYTHHLRVLKRY